MCKSLYIAHNLAEATTVKHAEVLPVGSTERPFRSRIVCNMLAMTFALVLTV